MKRDKIPGPTIVRLPLYYRCLLDLKDKDVSIVSSEEIASQAGIKASQFRKDMSYFGEFGIQGTGYPVDHLVERISSILQVDREHDVALVGVGHFGQSLAAYSGFRKWGFHVRYLFDNDRQIVGQNLKGVIVRHIDDIPEKLDVSTAVMTVPAAAAQETANRLINSGVKALLNFTGVKVSVPEDIVVRNVDLTHELAILTYHL